MPRLSVCLLTADPSDRLRAVLAPLADLADEVVIAADARVGAEELERYRGLADVVHRIEYRWLERHLGWLHAQCRGDWILRLDGDELPSAAAVAVLPELMARRDVGQYAFRQAWIAPDGDGVLTDQPWGTDLSPRLNRNDGHLRFGGGQHEHAIGQLPRELRAEPFYHLELALSPVERRRAKALRYEVNRPRLVAPGGGRFNAAYYLPEDRPSAAVERVAVADRAPLDRLLAAAGPPATTSSGPATGPVVPVAEMDAWWSGREVAPSACRAALEPLRARQRFAPGEHGVVLVQITNEGTERWPASLEDRPEIRVGTRWVDPDGALRDALRSPFLSVVPPGRTVLVPVAVQAPGEPGDHVLEIDVLLEHVRWFGAPCRVAIEVGVPEGLPPVGERLVASPEPVGELVLPRVIHRAWLGSAPMPPAERSFAEGLLRDNPGWTLREWTDADLPELGLGTAASAASRTPAELSNVVRYEVLARHGGVYVDTDVESRRPLEELLGGVRAFAGLELPGRVGTAALGAVPGHPAFVRAAAESRTTLGLGPHSADANGPYFLSLLLEDFPDVTIFGPERFYPYLWSEPERRGEAFPDAVLVHHWSMSWVRQETGASNGT